MWLNFVECVFFDHLTFDHMVTIQTGRAQLWNETNQDKLKKDLFANYDRFSKPTEHFNITKVKFGVSILHLEADERRSTVTVQSWLRMIWNDPKLQWNESDYGNVSVLRIADHEVWHPDLYLYNSASGGEPLIRFGAPNVLVYPNGEVLFVPPVEQKILCEFDLRYWPFDTQYCKLKYGSWVHHGYEIELSLYNSEARIDLSDLLLLHTWNITHTTGEVLLTTYDCCPQPYYALVFNFTITRNSHTYTTMVITPSVVSTFFLLTQFGLPPYAKEKIILNGCSLVLLNLFLLYFNHQIYTAGAQTPLIVLFYSSSLYIAGLTTLSAVVTSWMCTVRNTNKPLSNCLRKLLQTFVKWLFIEQYPCVSTYQERGELDEIKDDEDTDKKHTHTHTNLIQNEWTILAVCIDRLLFIMCIFTFIILAIRLS
ncbi:hypothetical protein RI129_012375 [Pyrocoelia pectoralis]|uniref:Neurotransmitter-gated ion-channel ligand-binding domain-containing protein n=1 Tax=Pyrocoelia pectoralis TaxID=417401 RepID=A0AAN7UT34_9COLE